MRDKSRVVIIDVIFLRIQVKLVEIILYFEFVNFNILIYAREAAINHG